LDETLKEIAGFLSGAWRDGQTVEVSLYACGRLKSREARRLLREAVKEQPCDWEHGDYNFLFTLETRMFGFFWRGKPLHITLAEGLFLFRWLVLGEASDRYALHNMRKRLGRGFWADVDTVRGAPPVYNTDCAFPDTHERNRRKPPEVLLKERRGLGLR
jgi:hypothetical protein